MIIVVAIVVIALGITAAAWLWTCSNILFPVKLHHKYTNKTNMSSKDECKAKAKLLLPTGRSPPSMA